MPAPNQEYNSCCKCVWFVLDLFLHCLNVWIFKFILFYVCDVFAFLVSIIAIPTFLVCLVTQFCQYAASVKLMGGPAIYTIQHFPRNIHVSSQEYNTGFPLVPLVKHVCFVSLYFFPLIGLTWSSVFLKWRCK